jgi:hypothetical protein
LFVANKPPWGRQKRWRWPLEANHRHFSTPGRVFRKVKKRDRRKIQRNPRRTNKVSRDLKCSPRPSGKVANRSRAQAGMYFGLQRPHIPLL